MHIRTLPLFAAAALAAIFPLAAPVLRAQDKDTPATMMIELEQAMPRKASAPGANVALSHSIDWEKAIQAIGSIVARSAGTTVEPQALFALGNAYYTADRLEEARRTFEDLKQRFSEHPLVRVALDPDNPRSLVDQALDDCIDELAFRQKHDVTLLPRPVLDRSLIVTLHLTSGQVKLRFYENVARKHRENFLKLAREGFYDRTRIHRVAPAMSVSLGDPNSRQDNPAEWGKGDPGYAIDHEFSLANHKAGTVTMFRGPGRAKSHGSQFQVLLTDHLHLDFVQTPFAEVVEGLDLLEKISRQTRNQYDAPVEEVFINGITIEQQPPK